MVLMDTMRNLSLPNPATAEFVAVAAFVHQNVARFQIQRFRFAFGYRNSFDLIQI